MKEIVFRLQDKIYNAVLGTKITKDSLYGRAKTIVEKDGIVLAKGYLTPEGEVMPRSAIDYAKLDPEGTILEEPVTEIDGVPASPTPSAFDRENELEQVEIKELIGFNVFDVYPINVKLPGGLYRTSAFCYRKSFSPREALLLVKAEDNAFLLIGERKQTVFVGQQVIYDFFDQEDGGDAEDELDFAMV